MRPTILLVALSLVTLGLTACSDPDEFLGTPANADAIVVGGSGADFATLGEAVAAADDGATIRVFGSQETGPVEVSRPVRIEGATAGALVSLSGAKVAAPDDSSDSSSAVLIIRDAIGVTVSGVAFSGPEDGILVRNSANVTIQDVNASSNGDDGIDIRGSSDVEVSGTFDGNGDRGIQIREGSSGIRVQSASARANTGDGLRARESSAVVVSALDASANGGDGAEFREVSTVSITGSTLVSNAEYGLRVRDSAPLTNAGNTIESNGEGDTRID